jgi:hypothetical protein
MAEFGVGILNGYLGILTLTNSILAYNTAHSSGGISNNGGTAMLTKRLSGNKTWQKMRFVR